jgi:acyl carrier protein
MPSIALASSNLQRFSVSGRNYVSQLRVAEMTIQKPSEQEIFDNFRIIVAKSLRIDPAQVTLDSYLNDLGVESLDLIEITMESESTFNVWLPEKDILQTANEVFGLGVVECDGYLTAEGKKMLARRMRPEEISLLEGNIAVVDIHRHFLKVSTWVTMLSNLVQYSPSACPQCGSALISSTGFRLKCTGNGHDVLLRSGEEINREWVQNYYNMEYAPQLNRGPAKSDAHS